MTNRTLPASLDEEMIDRHFARDPETLRTMRDDTLTALRDALGGGRVAAERAQRIADAILRDEMMTLPARHRRAKDEVWRAVEPATRRMDAAMERARRDLEAIERATAAPPTPRDAMAVILAGEIRARLAAMPADKRRSAMATALEAGDDSLHSAVLAGPALLSGLEATEQDVLRASWRLARHGPEVDRARRLTAALEDVERGGHLLLNFTHGLSCRSVVEKAEATERAAREAIAG